jgi:hypothetical protein
MPNAMRRAYRRDRYLAILDQVRPASSMLPSRPIRYRAGSFLIAAADIAV